MSNNVKPCCVSGNVTAIIVVTNFTAQCGKWTPGEEIRYVQQTQKGGLIYKENMNRLLLVFFIRQNKIGLLM